MTQPAALPALDALRRAYPTLRMLEAEAEAFQGTTCPHFCANSIWYGHTSRHPSLRNRTVTVANKAVKRFGTQRAYDLVYSAVYQKLPDCADCGCIRQGAA